MTTRYTRRSHHEFELIWAQGAAFINVILLLLLFLILTSSFIFPGTIAVKIPHAMTSDLAAENIMIILVSGENIIYWENKVVSTKILKQILSQQLKGNSDRTVLIKASQRASVGRVVELWDLCKGLGIQHIQIATTRDK